MTSRTASSLNGLIGKAVMPLVGVLNASVSAKKGPDGFHDYFWGRWNLKIGVNCKCFPLFPRGYFFLFFGGVFWGVMTVYPFLWAKTSRI